MQSWPQTQESALSEVLSPEYLTNISPCQQVVGQSAPLHLFRQVDSRVSRAWRKDSRQHSGVGGHDECRNGEPKEELHINTFVRRFWAAVPGLTWRQSCTSDFRDTEHKSGAKARQVTSTEKIQRHLQMAKAKEQDFSKAGVT